MDNALTQIVGRKRIILYPPTDVPYLYLQGDKSRITDVNAIDQFPLLAYANRYETILEPNDIIIIPGLLQLIHLINHPDLS
jgi:hypothetical protein